MSSRLGTIRYVGQMFRDRVDAGESLAEALSAYRGKDALILGIPRGGVPVAAAVARALDADLDVVVARKLGAPGSPELAIGAVTANGGRFLNDDLIAELGVPPSYVERVTVEQREESRRREERFRGGHSLRSIQGRIVIIVDDGLATGATMRAAVRSVRSQRPSKLVVAVPVGSSTACRDIGAEVDDFVCLVEPEPFFAVGLYYEHFDPTEDAEVHQVLDGFVAQHQPAFERAQ